MNGSSRFFHPFLAHEGIIFLLHGMFSLSLTTLLFTPFVDPFMSQEGMKKIRTY